MAKNLDVIMLFDFYKPMLTEKQADVIDLYYNSDLSLAEIAEHKGITRQGVRDSIKRAESTLYETEQRLGLVKRYVEISQVKDKIFDCISNIKTDDVSINLQLEKIKKLLTEIED